MATHVFFWGCQIPARHPFTEKATRLALPAVGVDFVDAPGFTCCPERSLIEVADEEAWLVTAARNLAVAAGVAPVLVASCNGCYGTLKMVSRRLAAEPRAREEINRALGAIGLEYRGGVQVKHLMEVLHDDVGPARVRRLLARPLRGLRVAVHYGCHMVRPSLDLGFDDPLVPTKMDTMVEALGAESVDYPGKMLCCGGYLSGVGETEETVALVRRKLQEISQLGVHALVTTCPSCFLQYDTNQFALQRRGERIHVPVFSYQELLALALGHSAEEIGVTRHRVDTSPFFEAWEKYRRDTAAIEEHIPLLFIERCAECGACERVCPVAQSRPGFEPNAIIRRVAAGHLEEVLEDGEFWLCVDCHTCLEMCPERFGMEKVFSALKHIAMERDRVPAGVKRAVATFLKTGRLIEPDDRTRARLGLEKFPAGGGEELARLLRHLGKTS